MAGELGRGRWDGEIQHLALYARDLEDEQVAAHARYHERYLARRENPPRVQVEARLRSVSAIPEPGAYPDALVVYAYDVRRVVEGEVADRRVLVAHWGVVNGQVQDAIRRRETGTDHRLVLEPFDAHPQLASLKLSHDDPEEALGRTVWVDVGR